MQGYAPFEWSGVCEAVVTSRKPAVGNGRPPKSRACTEGGQSFLVTGML